MFSSRGLHSSGTCQTARRNSRIRLSSRWRLHALRWFPAPLAAATSVAGASAADLVRVDFHMVTWCVLRVDCADTHHEQLDRTQAPNHHSALHQPSLQLCLHVPVRGSVSRSPHFILSSMCFNFPIPCRCRVRSVAFASMASTGFIS